MIPRMAIEPEPSPTFPEAPATLGRHERREGRDDRSIATRPGHQRPIVGGPSQPDGATGPLNWKAVHRDEVRHDLPPFRGP